MSSRTIFRNDVVSNCYQEDFPFPENKQSYRNRIWNHMEKNDIARFPRPVFGRIPNFVSAYKVTQRVLDLEEFQQAENILVGPDKPQHNVRIASIQRGKKLYVTVPRLSEGILKKIVVPENATEEQIYRATAREGIDSSPVVEIKDLPKIDLVIVGSVAVSCEGYRIGKGRGFVDLEFAILSELKVVNENTPIVSTVHSVQVFKSLRRDLFQSHDVPVDIICTPTSTIRVKSRLVKPKNIIWNLLDEETINSIPILKELRENINARLREEEEENCDNDPGHDPFEIFVSLITPEIMEYLRSNGMDQSLPQLEERAEKNSDQEFEKKATEIETNNNSPHFDYQQFSSEIKNVDQSSEVSASPIEEINEKSFPKLKTPVQRRQNGTKYLFKIQLRNVPKDFKIKQIREALKTRHIKTDKILWHPKDKKDCCYLFFRANNPSVKSDEGTGFGVDELMKKLNGLVMGDLQNAIDVVIVKPITRVETADVSSV